MKILVLSSGGVDSTTCLAMAVKEVGAESAGPLHLLWAEARQGNSGGEGPLRITMGYSGWNWI